METGQDWKIAALTFYVYVHFFYVLIRRYYFMVDKYMLLALEQAKLALDNGEVPIGAVIVKNDEVLSQAYNMKEKMNNVIGHAEIIAISEASKKVNNWRLDDCDMYISLEPCPMCASAIKQARFRNVYFSLRNSDVNNINIIRYILKKDKNNSAVNIYGGYFQNKSEKLLIKFFRNKRK